MAGNFFGGSKAEQVKYAGRDSYGDPDVVSTGIAEDLKAIGLKGISEDLKTLIGVWATKGKPVDDKKMTVRNWAHSLAIRPLFSIWHLFDQMEKLIAITTSLPETSATRHKLSSKIVDTLWDSLQHPPLSYHGDKFQYRTPDGSYNVRLQAFGFYASMASAETIHSRMFFNLISGRQAHRTQRQCVAPRRCMVFDQTLAFYLTVCNICRL